MDQLQRIHGVRKDASVGETAFASVAFRELDSGKDWLNACVPLGGYPIPLGYGEGYPFGAAEDLRRSAAWRRPLEDALAGFVLEIAVAVPIKYAVIGFEVSGEESVLLGDLATTTERYLAYVVSTGRGYQYVPTTVW